MKRTPLKRKPMKRRVKRKVSTDKRWRSEPYLAWIRSQSCCLCTATPCDPHHVIGLRWGLSGYGLTAPDSYAMPLCRACHGEVHKSPELQQQQPEWLAQTLEWAMQEFQGDTSELEHALAFVESKRVL